MARLDWRRRLCLLPSQTLGLLEASGLRQREVDVAAWAIEPCGRRHRGAAAVLAGLDQLLPGGPPLLRGTFGLPGLRHLADRAYRWVARNRHGLPGTAICSLRPPTPLSEAARAEIERRRDLGRQVAGEAEVLDDP